MAVNASSAAVTAVKPGVGQGRRWGGNHPRLKLWLQSADIVSAMRLRTHTDRIRYFALAPEWSAVDRAIGPRQLVRNLIMSASDT